MKPTRDNYKTQADQAKKHFLTYDQQELISRCRLDFDEAYLGQIRYVCLVMSRKYIETRFADILKYANVIEQRLDDSYLTKDALIAENEHNLAQCIAYGCEYLLIDKSYDTGELL